MSEGKQRFQNLILVETEKRKNMIRGRAGKKTGQPAASAAASSSSSSLRKVRAEPAEQQPQEQPERRLKLAREKKQRQAAAVVPNQTKGRGHENVDYDHDDENSGADDVNQTQETNSLRELAPKLLPDEEANSADFASAGLCEEVAEACRAAGWRTLTRIQAAVVPVALKEQRDIVGVAQTGSGKTGAYILPALHWMIELYSATQKQPFFSVLVLVPTRELAMQVADQFMMLGKSIGLRALALVGGEDMVAQAVALAKRPHVVAGTPGRVKDHLTNTRGFAMPRVKWFILDEADKMLEMDYEKEIDFIVDAIRPINVGAATVSANGSSSGAAASAASTALTWQRQTMLFSATFSAKVDRLQRASLKNPVLLQVHRANTTVDTLKQYFVFAPFAEMLTYLHVYLAQVEKGQHILIFCSSGATVHKVTLALRVLGHRALPLMGKMSQQNRLRALTQFKDKAVRVLVCTDVAQRGLDIPHVDVVVNYSLPANVKEYIHRVGRTARAGSDGKAVNFVSQYDVGLLQSIEEAAKVKMEEIAISDQAVEAAAQRVALAEMEASREVKEQERLEKLDKEEDQLTGHAGSVANRTRAVTSSSSSSGNDFAHAAETHGMQRTRREHESMYQTTRKQQKRDLGKAKKAAMGRR